MACIGTMLHNKMCTLNIAARENMQSQISACKLFMQQKDFNCLVCTKFKQRLLILTAAPGLLVEIVVI